MIWAYLGAGTPPTLPPYDILAREDGVQRVARVKADCNYFQILENDVDPVHTAILHTDTDLSAAYQEIPEFECEETEAGLCTIAWRPSSQYRRRVEFALPTLGRVTLPFMKPLVQMGVWATPNDDEYCTLFFSWFLPIGPAEEGRRDDLVARMEHHMFETTPDDRRTLSSLVVNQDLYACASQGPIVDRAVETLGTSDRAVLMLRRVFFRAIDLVEKGETPPGVIREPVPELLAFDKVA
jgi:5,5'-dehydrodivanillate O-demethylase